MAIRVQLREEVIHTFIIEKPVDDDEAIADAAEQIFVHSKAEELDSYSIAIKDRRLLFFEEVL